MGNCKIEIELQKGTIEGLSDEEKSWINAALAAAKRAYAPYSGFQVGAVAVLADGTLVPGNNQENAAYPSGLCAERVALFTAGANYPDVPVRRLVLIAVKDGVIQDRVSPCGACRQVLLETEQRYHQPIKVMLCGEKEYYLLPSAGALLPLAFSEANLNK